MRVSTICERERELSVKKGFDNEKYTRLQSEKIKERISQFDKLYLEFGGKLFDDYHASRVLPGFEPDSKLKMLLTLADQAEIIIVISAKDIEKNKIRGDLGITYDKDVLRLRSVYTQMGLYVGSVVITQYDGQKAADQFKAKLEKQASRFISITSSTATPTRCLISSATRAMGKTTTSAPAVRW